MPTPYWNGSLVPTLDLLEQDLRRGCLEILEKHFVKHLHRKADDSMVGNQNPTGNYASVHAEEPIEFGARIS